jgi:hypothetical protein
LFYNQALLISSYSSVLGAKGAVAVDKGIVQDSGHPQF